METDLNYYIHLGVIGKQEIVYTKNAVKEFGKALGTIPNKADNVRNSIIKWGTLSNTLSVAQNSVQQIAGVMDTFIQKSNAATESQTKLRTVMQQRMSATDADVSSVNNLIKAQTELGVVGGTVQRSGMQQLATFASHKETLEKLLPAMNNLLVQQNGLNSTNENAVGIANLMGKALMGNYSALKRVGITLTDSQIEMIKTGDEGQRASAIAEAITQNVGNMNAEMAKTDAGKVKQATNRFAALQATIGSMMSPLQAFINQFGQFGLAVSGISQLATALRGVGTAMGLNTAIAKIHAASMLTTQLAMGGVSAAATRAAYALTAVKLAFRGILIATGVGIVIAGISAAFEALSSSSGTAVKQLDSTKDSVDSLANATEEAKNSISSQVAAYNMAIAKTKDFKGSKEKEKSVVEELNNTYGSTLGVYSSVAQWYQVLTNNAATYTKMLLAQAKMQILANKAAKDQLDLEELERQHPDLKNPTVTTKGGRTIYLPSKRQLNGYDRNLSPSENAQVNRLKNLRVSKGSDGKWNVDNIAKTHSQLMQSIAQETEQMDSLQKEIAGYKTSFKTAPDLGGGKSGGGHTPARSGGSRTGGGHTPAKGGSVNSDKQKSLIVKDTMSYSDYLNNSEYYQQEIDKLDANNPGDMKKIEKLSKLKNLVDDILDKYKQLASAPEPPKPDDELHTYAELDDAISYYESELKYALPENRKDIQAHVNNLNDMREAWRNASKAASFDPGSIADYNDKIQKLDAELNNVNLTEAERNRLLRERAKIQKSLDGMQAVSDAADVDMSDNSDNDSTDYEALLERLNRRRADLLKKVRPDMTTSVGALDIKTGKTEDLKFDFTVEGMNDLAEVSNLIDKIRKRKKKLDKESAKKGLMDQYGGEVVQTQQNIIGLAKSFEACGATAETVGSAIAFAGQSLQQLGGKGAAAKAAAIASSIGQLALGYAYATSQAGQQLGPWGWVAFGLAGLAQLITMVNTISGFATGGIVGGNSYTGDRVVAHVNSGEMILNAREQARLFQIATGAMQPVVSYPARTVVPSVNTSDFAGSGMMSSGKIIFKVRGRDMVAMLANDTRIGSKIGKRTNINI